MINELSIKVCKFLYCPDTNCAAGWEVLYRQPCGWLGRRGAKELIRGREEREKVSKSEEGRSKMYKFNLFVDEVDFK